MNPDLSIIIVNWNTKQLLLQCLASLAQSPVRHEVVVVDNGSKDGSAAAVREKFPSVKIIRCERNRGYATANMHGFRASTGRYVLFLNSDTIVPPETLPRMIFYLEGSPQAAACGPRLAREDGATQAYAFGKDPTLLYLLARAFARQGLRAPLHDWETSEVQTVDWISGACLMVRRAAIEQVSGFDEHIFMYFEDNDLCLRLRRAGWRIVYDPQVHVIHLGGASLTNNTLRRKYYYDSLIYFYSKHYSLLERLALRMMLPLYCWRFRGPHAG